MEKDDKRQGKEPSAQMSGRHAALLWILASVLGWVVVLALLLLVF